MHRLNCWLESICWPCRIPEFSFLHPGHNCLSLQRQVIWHPLLASANTYTQSTHTYKSIHLHINKNKSSKRKSLEDRMGFTLFVAGCVVLEIKHTIMGLLGKSSAELCPKLHRNQPRRMNLWPRPAEEFERANLCYRVHKLNISWGWTSCEVIIFYLSMLSNWTYHSTTVCCLLAYSVFLPFFHLNTNVLFKRPTINARKPVQTQW